MVESLESAKSAKSAESAESLEYQMDNKENKKAYIYIRLSRITGVSRIVGNKLLYKKDQTPRMLTSILISILIKRDGHVKAA